MIGCRRALVERPKSVELNALLGLPVDTGREEFG